MREKYIKTILKIILIFLMIIAFEKSVSAAGARDNVDDGATGTYLDGERVLNLNIVSDINTSKDTKSYTITANTNSKYNMDRPIYQFDTIDLNIHVRFNSIALGAAKKIGMEEKYDKNKMLIEKSEFTYETNFTPEADIYLKIRPLTTGTVECKLGFWYDKTILYLGGTAYPQTEVTLTIEGIKPFSDRVEQELKKNKTGQWMERYIHTDLGEDETVVVKNVLNFSYRNHMKDNPTEIEADSKIFAFDKPEEDTGWVDMADEDIMKGIVYRRDETIVVTAMVNDQSVGVVRGEKYRVKVCFILFWETDPRKILYQRSSHLIMDAEGKETDFADHQQYFDDRVKEPVEELFKNYAAIFDDIEEGRDTVKFTDVFDDMLYYASNDSIGKEEEQKLVSKINTVLSVITNIGMILAVIMPAIVGVKYMISSVEEKAEYKKDMIPYLVGAFLLFGICTIVKILQQFGQSINNI